jgi:hypothetical protein
MVVDIYNGIYAVPGKCGSRYWSKTDLFNKWDIPTIPRAAFDDIYYNKIKIKIDYIIIRNPLSHLKAALQTEIMDYFDDVDMIEFILKRFSNPETGGAHFHPKFCQRVYKLYCRSNFKLGIVDLIDLTDFLKSIGFDIPYDSKDFDFLSLPNYKSKTEIWYKCVELYPDMMNKLINYTQVDMQYYNALLSGDKGLVKSI